MLTTEEFRAWCQRLQLSKETEEIITTIRSSPPVRKVKGRAGNVSGKYPSPKMQVVIGHINRPPRTQIGKKLHRTGYGKKV